MGFYGIVQFQKISIFCDQDDGEVYIRLTSKRAGKLTMLEQ